MSIARPTIRPIRPADGEAIAAFHRRAILATSRSFYTAEELESWAGVLHPERYASSVQEGGVFEVAVDERGTPIAFCHWREDAVLGLYVDPEFQRHGLGGLLLRRAEAAIGGSGHRRIGVKASISAVPFYERHGYRVLRTVEHATRGGLSLAAAELEKSIGV